MGLSAPWYDFYPNNCFETPNFHYQNFSSKTIIFDFILVPVKNWYKYTFKYVLSDDDSYK